MAQVLNEPVIYLMWPRSVLMQLAHPDIAATEVVSGVYGNRGAQRWAGTIEYLRVAIGGRDEHRRDLIRDVNAVHAAVRVPDDHPEGVRRPVFDPRLQRWVVATWFVSIVDTYRLLVGPLDDDTVERLYREFQPAGTLLQMGPADWPADVAALRAYVAYMEGEFPARLPRSGPDDPPEFATPGDVAAQVFSTYSLRRRYVRRIGRVRLLTWGMAGEGLRSVYGIEWTAAHDRRFERCVRSIRRLHTYWPGTLRRRHGRRVTRRYQRSPHGRASAGLRASRSPANHTARSSRTPTNDDPRTGRNHR